MENKKIDIYKLFTIFYICSFIGWCFENIIILISQHKFNESGLLFILGPLGTYLSFISSITFISKIPLIIGLPIIEIYGYGGLIINFAFKKIQNNIVKLFFYGIFLMTSFELVASYFCTLVLNRRYWNYDKQFMNFDGRISLIPSLAWGVITILVIKYIIPYIDSVYQKYCNKKWFKNSLIGLTIYTSICMYLKYILHI